MKSSVILDLPLIQSSAELSQKNGNEMVNLLSSQTDQKVAFIFNTCVSVRLLPLDM